MLSLADIPLLLAALHIPFTGAQQASATLSDCHFHGADQYCVLPNGEETALPPSSTTDGPTASTNAPSSAEAQTTAVTSCHMHETQQFCLDGSGEEFMVMATGGSSLGPSPPASYTGCHPHESELYCYGPNEEETPFVAAAAPAATGTTPGAGDEVQPAGGAERNCHFHAGVEHCVGGGESEGAAEGTSPTICQRQDRSYNIPLRIGTLFAVFSTSALAVFTPILLTRFSNIKTHGTFFAVFKQFGTGVIISTAFVHLLTHSQLLFANQCLGELVFEGTASAILMAGAFFGFLLQYGSIRVSEARGKVRISGENAAAQVSDTSSTKLRHEATALDGGDAKSVRREDPLSAITLGLGIIFHSAIIGVTLIVAGDSFYITLFVVITFHQMFEGFALGMRIAALHLIRLRIKLLMAAAFALITPLGMAIGLGVLSSFNGNDKSTIIAIGTLDAFSAGILAWAGFVQMWSADWIHGDLRDSGILKTMLSLFGLIAGLVAMSVLGKWA